ncbi:MAG: hypothetical protein PUA78_06735, partial [Porphyromonadaceae bacterium]|nr:hypothetical protein [Porphyromonadaceae bacterium]
IIQLEDKGVPFPTTGSGGHAVLHVPSIPHFRLNLKNSSTEVWRCPIISEPAIDYAVKHINADFITTNQQLRAVRGCAFV